MIYLITSHPFSNGINLGGGGTSISDMHHVSVNRPPFLNWLVPNDPFLLLGFLLPKDPLFFPEVRYPMTAFLTRQGNEITYSNLVTSKIFQTPAPGNLLTPRASTQPARFYLFVPNYPYWPSCTEWTPFYRLLPQWPSFIFKIFWMTLFFFQEVYQMPPLSKK